MRVVPKESVTFESTTAFQEGNQTLPVCHVSGTSLQTGAFKNRREKVRTGYRGVAHCSRLDHSRPADDQGYTIPPS